MLVVDGRSIPYRLVRSPRARRITIRVTPEGVSVTAPRRVSAAGVERALAADRAWLAGALERAAALVPPPPADGAELPYLDGVLRVAVGGTRPPRREGDVLWLPQDADPAASAERWYRAQARRHLGALVDEWAARMDVAPSGLAVRGQRSRWGSASARGVIALNWRLMLAPSRVGEYVVVHELAHLVHMDHSPRFWALVSAHWPDHRADRAWLRANGAAVLAQLRGPVPGSVVSAG
ncbi:MAG: SprT family zinc-dependent metalloprotease [Thermoleophilia bacterium]